MTDTAPAGAQPLATTGPTERDVARDFKLWRLCAAGGTVYAVGVLLSWAGLAGFVPPPPEYWDPAQTASFYAEHEVRIRLGMEGVLFFAFFYYPFTLAIARLIKRVEGPEGFLSRIQHAGGLVTALITMGCALFWLTASFRAGSRDPGDIQLLNDIGWMIFDMTVIATAFQIVAFGTARLLESRRPQPLMPRWLGYLSYWLALTFVAVYFMPSFQSGPFSWQGLITFYVGLGAFFVWVIIAIPYTVRAISIIEREEAGRAALT